MLYNEFLWGDLEKGSFAKLDLMGVLEERVVVARGTKVPTRSGELDFHGRSSGRSQAYNGNLGRGHE